MPTVEIFPRIPLALRTAVLTLAVSVALAGCSALGMNQSPSPLPSPPPSEPGVGSTPSATASAGTDTSPTTRADFTQITHLDSTYDILTLPLSDWDIRIDWDGDPEGTLLGEAVEAGDDVVVATNAGIFTPELVPGGLLVSDGETKRDLNLRDGGGNFHLMPNAVFAVYDDGTAAIVDSVDYTADSVTFATQSGPALILDGEVHHAFNEESSNLAWRSGVGVSPDGKTVYLVISRHLVTFHGFATLFRDQLGVDDALYLDGNISGMWVEGVRELDAEMGPFAGIITAAPRAR